VAQTPLERRAAAARVGSGEWERELLYATRDALPLCRASRERRALASLVATLQQYLRAARAGKTYVELADLYRVASTQVVGPGDARAYAEKLGANRVPLLLGELAIDPRAKDVPPPTELGPRAIHGAHSLLCLPAGGHCEPWAGPATPSAAARATR
jgi:hypothetical protein